MHCSVLLNLVSWCITDNDWRDRRPQVSMHCYLSPF